MGAGMVDRQARTGGGAAGGSGRATAVLVLIAANACLALGPWLVRLSDTGPVATGFWRLALALPVLAVFAGREGGGRKGSAVPRGALMLAVAVGGLFFAADLAAWHLGIVLTKAANATLFGNTASLLFPMWAFAVAREWPNRRQSLALVLAAAGGALLMGQSFEIAPEHLIGDALCLAAGVLYTGYLVALKGARGRLGSWSVLAWSTAWSTPALLLTALLMGEQVWPPTTLAGWTPLLALAALSQLAGQGMLIWALGAVRPLVVGLALLTQPVVAAITGWLAFGEVLTTGDLAGAALVAAALVLAQRRAVSPPAAAPVAPPHAPV